MDFFKFFHFGLKRKYKILILVFLLLFGFFGFVNNSFCATSVAPMGTVSGVAYSDNQIVSGNNTLYYFKLIKGHRYIITNTDNINHESVFTDVVPSIGVSATRRAIYAGNSITVVANRDYFGSFNYSVDVQDEGVVSYNGAIWSLNDSLSSDNFWTVFKSSIPYIFIIVVISLGFWFIRSLFNKIVRS